MNIDDIRNRVSEIEKESTKASGMRVIGKTVHFDYPAMVSSQKKRQSFISRCLSRK